MASPRIVTRKEARNASWWYLLCSVFVCRLHRLLYWRRNIANCGLRLGSSALSKGCSHSVGHILLASSPFNVLHQFSVLVSILRCIYIPQWQDASEQKLEFCLCSERRYSIDTCGAYFRVLTKRAVHHTFNFRTSCTKTWQLSSLFIESVSAHIFLA